MRILALVIAALFFLTGCAGGDTEAVPTETVTVTAEPEVEALSDEELFLSVVRDEYPVLVGMEDDTIIGLVEASCDMLDSGASVDDVFDVILSGGVTAEQGEVMAYVIGAGVVVYCPEHQSTILNSGSNV